MTLTELCDKINLQTDIKNRAIHFASGFHFETIDKQLKDFLIYEKMNDARAELQTILGNDEDNIKILTCMLKASVDAYEIYKEKGIYDKIYFDTMKSHRMLIDERRRIF